MEGNPFFVKPPDIMSALAQFDASYKSARDYRKANERDAAYAAAGQQIKNGGLDNETLGNLAALGPSASPLVTALANFGKQDKTDTLKNLAAENEMRAGRGQPMLSPLDYEMQREKAKAAVTNVTSNVNASVNPILKGISERFNESVEGANASRQQIDAIHEARFALDNGAITGAGANQRLMLTKAAGLFGLPQEAAVNTETLRSAMGQQVLANAKKLGANPSNADRDLIQKIVGGDIDLNEGTIRILLDMQERWARDGIKRTNLVGKRLLQANPNELGKYQSLLNVDDAPDYETYKRGRQPQGGPQGIQRPDGARQARDGNYYVPDPQRPGKYLMVR